VCYFKRKKSEVLGMEKPMKGVGSGGGRIGGPHQYGLNNNATSREYSQNHNQQTGGMNDEFVPSEATQLVQSGKLSKEEGEKLKQMMAERRAGSVQNSASNPDELKDQLQFLYPSVGEVLHTDPSKLGSGGFTLNAQQQAELNDYGDKIKNVLAWNIMTQMLVKGSQMAMDSFLLAEKWQYEQQITVMQFMQTMAQMALSYINNMSQSWDQLWAQYKQKQQEVQQAELQAISGR
jgi:hypothetical protein